MANELDFSKSNVKFGDGDLGGLGDVTPDACAGGASFIGCIAVFCGDYDCYTTCTHCTGMW